MEKRDVIVRNAVNGDTVLSGTIDRQDAGRFCQNENGELTVCGCTISEIDQIIERETVFYHALRNVRSILDETANKKEDLQHAALRLYSLLTDIAGELNEWKARIPF